MVEDSLNTVLLEGSLPVADLVAGKLSFREFVSRYDSFYYRSALDGFDASDSWRAELVRAPEVVELHRQVQEVLDRAYLSDASNDATTFEAAGRVSEEVACRMIREIAARCGLEAHLTALQREQP